MTARRRGTRSLPMIETTERHITKKEKENSPLRFQTCPPLPKKNQRSQLRGQLFLSTSKAVPLSFERKLTLSKQYDPTKITSYLSQLYKVCGTIGEGSFGTVYQVLCKEDNKVYALKVSKKGCKILQNQYEEVRRLEKIGDHPNLLKYFFAWEEDSMIFMQIELCGSSLDIFAKANHSISEEQQWDILIDILLALKHLHSYDLIHLDVKPDNIMMSNDGLYKLGDFGLLLDLKEHNITLQQGKSMDVSEGDAKYLAREILDGNYTGFADIFSLGIMMLELATDLVLPDSGPLWHQLRRGKFQDAFFKLIPSKLRAVIRKMMQPNFLRRPTAIQLLSYNHIQKVIADQKVVPRVNYYKLWNDANKSKRRLRAVAVCLNLDRNGEAVEESARSLELMNNDLGVEPMEFQNENNNDSDASSDSCVTPPRKVSEIVLRPE